MNALTTSNTAPQRMSVAWPPFAKKLAAVLKRLAEDQFLIISVKGSNRFVQFAGGGAFGMRAETVCNAYLPTSDQLGDRQIATLRVLGWQDPTASPDKSTPERVQDGSPNFFVEYSVPVPFGAIAELTVRTFVEVLRAPHPGRLQYHSFESDGGALIWPELGLKRANTNPDARETIQRLLATMAQETGVADLEFDADGDIGVRYGSALAWVCLMGNPPHVHIRSALLQDVEGTPRLMARLNELNGGIGHLRFFHRNRCIHAVTEIPAAPYEPDHVARALHNFCHVADGIDELLQSEFGGSTAFADDMPSALKH